MKSTTKLSWAIFYTLQFVLVGLVIILFWKLTAEVKKCTIGINDIKYQLEGAQITYE
jgi:hypothetical protein